MAVPATAGSPAANGHAPAPAAEPNPFDFFSPAADVPVPALKAPRRAKPAPEWNHYRVTCQDGAIKLAVNGKEVSGGYACRPRKGYLCLESEGSPVEFRNLSLRELP